MNEIKVTVTKEDVRKYLYSPVVDSIAKSCPLFFATQRVCPEIEAFAYTTFELNNSDFYIVVANQSAELCKLTTSFRTSQKRWAEQEKEDFISNWEEKTFSFIPFNDN